MFPESARTCRWLTPFLWRVTDPLHSIHNVIDPIGKTGNGIRPSLLTTEIYISNSLTPMPANVKLYGWVVCRENDALIIMFVAEEIGTDYIFRDCSHLIVR
ncbi:MAG: hypothetical protein AAFM91_08620 [Pseudomonadota bacterium]